MNNQSIVHSSSSLTLQTHQTGAVLIVSLIMLLLLTLIGVTGMQTTSLEEKMTSNMRDKDLAFQAAESALNAAETTLNPVPPAVLPTFTDAGTGGFYSSTPTTPITDVSLLDSFWTDAARQKATSTVTGLGNGIATPRYIIQVMGATDCPGAALGSLLCTNYRITARATGGSTNAVVILESIYSR
jgi:type IV pilus assembly protein PilX